MLWLTSENFGWPQYTGKFSYCKEESSILSFSGGGMRRVTAVCAHWVGGWSTVRSASGTHGDTRDMALCHTRAATLLPRAGWLQRQLGGSHRPWDLSWPWPSTWVPLTRTLASEFPGWMLAFRSQDDSPATTLSVTHPIWVDFSALYDVTSTTENIAGTVSFASLGEA